jgi:preprotein translocase subunit SecG
LHQEPWRAIKLISRVVDDTIFRVRCDCFELQVHATGVIFGLPASRISPKMLILLVILHVIVCLFLIGVVLIQQGKSADLAGAFGGQGSQTAFGPRGAANLLTRLTTYSAIIFMLTSIGLTIMMSRATTHRSVLSDLPSSQSTPAKK